MMKRGHVVRSEETEEVDEDTLQRETAMREDRVPGEARGKGQDRRHNSPSQQTIPMVNQGSQMDVAAADVAAHIKMGWRVAGQTE